MTHDSEAHRSTSEPLLSPRSHSRRSWSATRPARTAAVLLLLVWVGPVSIAQTDSWWLLRWLGAPERASAESRVIPVGAAVHLAPGTLLRLHLRDGSVVGGRYLQRTLLDSALYAQRFAAAVGSLSYLPLVLGETLNVSLHDGREWTAPFAGYGQLTLLLRRLGGEGYLRAPFEFVKEIRRANGDSVGPSALTRAFHAGLLPSAEALALERDPHTGSLANHWARTVQVPVEDVEFATVELSSGGSSGSAVAGGIVLGVVVGVVLFYVLLAASFRNADSGCKSSTANVPYPYPGYSDVRFTKRPFDRDRACYMGDPLAAAGPWPGPPVDDAATAVADLPASHALGQ